MKPPSYDVIIPTCRHYEEVKPLAQEVMLQALNCPRYYLRVYPTCRPRSASRNRNIGLDHAESELIFMLDDDVTALPPNWVTQLIDVMRDFPNCVMTSARLLDRNGKPGPMVSTPQVFPNGSQVVPQRELPTACIVIRRNEVRFDENYIGSGFEDNDYCRQLWDHYGPEAEFRVCEDVRVTHLNEQKNQGGEYWEHNRAYFNRKWSEKR